MTRDSALDLNPALDPISVLHVDDHGEGSHSFLARLPGSIAREKFATFLATQESSRLVSCESGQACIQISGGRRSLPGVELRLSIEPVAGDVRLRSRVVARFRPFGKGPVDPTSLENQYHRVLRTLKSCFLAEDLDRRNEPRTRALFPVRVWALHDDGHTASIPAAQGRDFSESGLAIESAQPIGTHRAIVDFEVPGHVARRTVQAAIRAHSSHDGVYSYHVSFMNDGLGD
jgi:hypothetical protein